MVMQVSEIGPGAQPELHDRPWWATRNGQAPTESPIHCSTPTWRV